MNPAVPSSTNTVSLTPGVAFVTKKNAFFSKCTLSRKLNKQLPVLSQKYILPFSTSFKLFPQFRISCSFNPKQRTHITLATGTEVTVGEVDLSTTDNDVSKTVKDDSESNVESSNISKVIEKRSRPVRKSDMSPVKNEELIPGAIFNGKVISIQPFGAFVDFGAFTDGLVHVSQLSDSFVKDVASVVAVGQEVKVRLVEVNMEKRRISLTMRVSDNKPQQQNDAPGSDKSRPPRNGNRKKEEIKNSKFVKGQDLDGMVKNTTRSGTFITLPEGEEGFLPTSEEAGEGFVSMMGGSSLEIGQEVKVRVLRINRGKVTLTMKKEEAGGELDAKLSQGVVHMSTNPFMIAFRSNKVISDFLDERVNEDVLEIKIESVKEVESSSVTLSNEGPAAKDKVTEGSSLTEEKEDEEESMLTVDATEKTEPDVSGEITHQTLSDVTEEVKDKPDEDIIAKDEDQNEKPDSIDSYATSSVEESVTADREESDSNENSTAQIVSPEGEMAIADLSESFSSISDSQVLVEDTENKENVIAVNEVETQTFADSEEKASAIDLSAQSSDTSPKEATTKAAISPALVKQLRDETGAGMMDCKKALLETGGDILKAQEYLRKKGLASADKKSSRATAEGRIGSYIHDSRIGVLIEVNCETDFVARGDIFKELVEDLAMQVAACPQVQYLSTDDIPKEMIDKEKEIEMQKEDLLSKPEQIRSKIVDGRIRKRMEELALLDQTFIKDDKVVVKDWVKQTISTIGENIKVQRFVRYNLGEGLEKKNQDFAAEVAAQTVSKPTATTVVQEPVATEAKESIEKPLKAVVSAALVKQLRDETGAGMMDCKKALAETEGDLEKAVEFLRKKGLSTADKKSSRLAAEGRIGSYIHDSRIGVLIEVNCETDFVGRSENFKRLVDDLAMQVVACPQVQYVSIEDIPESIVSREKQLEMQREDLQSKAENIREKIVEGRIGKRLGELVLLEQAFIKDDSLLVKDLVKQTVAGLGENIKIRRFVRFTLGEGRVAESVTEA